MTDLNPDQELQAAMQAAGLNPPDYIRWDGRFHRFPGIGAKNGKDDAGWYKAYPDREGAIFGCKRTNLSEKWQLEKDRTDWDPERWAKAKKRWRKQEAERKRARAQAERAAAALARRIWKESEPATKDHLYLVRKGIDDPRGLRVDDKNRLLVPMLTIERNPATHKPALCSLLRIYPDGSKRFLEGGRVKRTRTTIGAELLERDENGDPVPGQTIFICEGWATGWSISKCAGAPVLVAFMVSNLEAVARYAMKSFRGQRVVIAADNDRWSRFNDPSDNEPKINPGVLVATKVAAELGCHVAIPDFPDDKLFKGPSGKGPTDFNDLHRIAGPDAVVRWLDPERAGEATIEDPELREELGPTVQEPDPLPKPTEDEEPTPAEEPAKKKDTNDWRATAPFRVLGQDRGTYYFMPKVGQVKYFQGVQLERKGNLFQLAPLHWWERYFPSGNGVSWAKAANALIQEAHRHPIYSPEHRRGRGCWIEYVEEDGVHHGQVLLHLGSDMIVPGRGKPVRPDDYVSPGGWVYERQKPLRGPSREGRMDFLESTRILEVFRGLLWQNSASADLLAGWCALAPLCGALQWRPHVWVVGERGAGKSTVIEDLVLPLLGDMYVPVVGQTTEAGIRGKLESDALPVIFDEAEEGEGVGNRIQRVLALARQASSETQAETLKGTQTGGSVVYKIRSMFCFASIGGAVYQEADRSRVSLLQLRGPSQATPAERARHWESFQPKLKSITPEMGPRLIARTLYLLRKGILGETIDVFMRAAGQVLGDQRLGDQYGTLYAGAWSLQHDDVPSSLVAREIVGSDDLTEYQEDHQPEGRKALSILMQQRERVETSSAGPRTLSVGELVHAASGGTVASVSQEEAARTLGQIGMRVEVIRGAYWLIIANSGEWISRALQGTPYARGIRTILRSLEGVQGSPNVVRFNPGVVSRGTMVPFRYIDPPDDEG